MGHKTVIHESSLSHISLPNATTNPAAITFKVYPILSHIPQRPYHILIPPTVTLGSEDHSPSAKPILLSVFRIKFYKIVTPICFHIVCDYFYVPRAGWTNCSKDYKACRAEHGYCLVLYSTRIPGGASGEAPRCPCSRHKRHGLDPWVQKTPWRGARHPTLALRIPRTEEPGRGPSGSPWGRKEPDTIEATQHTQHFIQKVCQSLVWTITVTGLPPSTFAHKRV